MMPLKHILKNKLLLQKNFNTQESSMDEWPYWLFEENIKIANEIIEEEERIRRKEEEEYKLKMPNINVSSLMRESSNIINKIKK